MPRWALRLRNLARRLWVRTALFCVAALLAAGLAFLLGPWVPQELADRFGGDAVEQILAVLSSSMLAVTTFSLGTMVAAHTSATSSATPRAAPLIVEDNYAQNAISTFLGTFVFSVVALVALDAGAYGAGERSVLFGTTLLLLGVVVAAMVRWVDELSRLGQMRDTVDRLEKLTKTAIDTHLRSPFARGQPYAALPAEGEDIVADEVGYLQTVDFDALREILEPASARSYLCCAPGTFARPHQRLCRIVGLSEDQFRDAKKDLVHAFVIGPQRTLVQDPRFGLEILAEVASRALSPGINDPGSAVHAMVAATRTLDHWHRCVPSRFDDADAPETLDWLFANPMVIDDLADDIFLPVIHYGPGHPRVIARLFECLAALEAMDRAVNTPSARRIARRALMRAETAIEAQHERDAIRRRFHHLFGDEASVGTTVADDLRH